MSEALSPIPRPASPAPTGLADALRARTARLHVRAERSGIVRAILRGRASRHGYALFLRNLLPAYRELEAALEQRRAAAGLWAVARPALYRSAALASDLAGLGGPDRGCSLPLLPEAEAYAHRIAAAARDDASRLIAHAYVRYLGDLSGGQIVRRRLAETIGLGPAELSFYDFPGISDPEGFVAGYRADLDRAGHEIADPDGVVEEAAAAFHLNIALSEAVHALAG